MRYKSKSKKRSAANAQEAKAQKQLCEDNKSHEISSDSESDVEVMSWLGSVKNHLIVSDSDSDSMTQNGRLNPLKTNWMIWKEKN